MAQPGPWDGGDDVDLTKALRGAAAELAEAYQVGLRLAIFQALVGLWLAASRNPLIMAGGMAAFLVGGAWAVRCAQRLLVLRRVRRP